MTKTVKPKMKPWKHKTEGAVIVPEFICGDMQYYRIKDTYALSAHRGFSALDTLEEWQKRLTAEKHIEFIEAIKIKLNSNPIELSEVFSLVTKMEERLKYPVPTEELIWKMASVVFFDENEDPGYYDPAYAMQVKIPHWKQHYKEVNSFFLHQRLTTLIGLPSISESDFLLLMTVVKEAEKIQGLTLTNILQQFSKNPIPSVT